MAKEPLYKVFIIKYRNICCRTLMVNSIIISLLKATLITKNTHCSRTPCHLFLKVVVERILGLGVQIAPWHYFFGILLNECKPCYIIAWPVHQNMLWTAERTREGHENVLCQMYRYDSLFCPIIMQKRYRRLRSTVLEKKVIRASHGINHTEW